MGSKKLILDILVGIINRATKKEISTKDIKDNVKLASKSRTVWFNIGLIVTGLVGVATPYLEQVLSKDSFSLLTAIIGVIGTYLRATTVTPEGVFGKNEIGDKK